MTTLAHLWDSAIRKSNEWVLALDRDLGIGEPRQALTALRAVLHALRDRLPPGEAVELAAQMPLIVKGVYFDGWDPSRTPKKIRTKEDFLGLVDRGLHGTTLAQSPERTTRAVFRLLASRVSEGEIRDVVGILPHELAELWEDATHGLPL